MSVLDIEVDTLCNLADEAADQLKNVFNNDSELADAIRKVTERIRSIINEQPDDHENTEHTAQFHRGVADEKSKNSLLG